MKDSKREGRTGNSFTHRHEQEVVHGVAFECLHNSSVTANVSLSVSAVMCGNVAQRVNSLCFSLRSLLFHTVHSKSDNCHAALLSFSLISHSSLSDSQ